MIAAGQGLEPQYHPPEGCVLPLDEPAIFYTHTPTHSSPSFNTSLAVLLFVTTRKARRQTGSLPLD